jgi:hypothetical protein
VFILAPRMTPCVDYRSVVEKSGSMGGRASVWSDARAFTELFTRDIVNKTEESIAMILRG